MSIELDELDKLAASVFDGYLVRKDLVRKYSRQYPVPTYVVEFLLGRYCASVNESEIAEGLEIVEKQLKDRTVRTGEEELFKARAKETGSVKIIDILRAKLDAKNDCYVTELPSLNLRDVRIDDQLVRDNERMLTDGFYAEVTLAYDGIIAQEKGGRPFGVSSLRPIQMSKADVLDVYSKARGSFSTDQWIDFLLRSIGLEPAAFNERAKRVVLLRMVPFVERNYNLIELGPRGTGKSHLFHFLRPEGRRQHHEGLHGLGPIQPRQREHPRRGQRRHGREPRRRCRATAESRSPPEPDAARDARRYGIHGSNSCLRARLGLSACSKRRSRNDTN
jgi:ATP-dependent Lon protease